MVASSIQQTAPRTVSCVLSVLVERHCWFSTNGIKLLKSRPSDCSDYLSKIGRPMRFANLLRLACHETRIAVPPNLAAAPDGVPFAAVRGVSFAGVALAV